MGLDPCCKRLLCKAAAVFARSARQSHDCGFLRVSEVAELVLCSHIQNMFNMVILLCAQPEHADASEEKGWASEVLSFLSLQVNDAGCVEFAQPCPCSCLSCCSTLLLTLR